jgi:hypothetical protein
MLHGRNKRRNQKGPPLEITMQENIFDLDIRPAALVFPEQSAPPFIFPLEVSPVAAREIA